MFSNLDDAIFAWDADARRVHCSNCVCARVKGDVAHPVAFCAAGHGGHIPLEELVRKNSHGFRRADACDDFESSDGTTRRQVDDAD